MQAKTYSQRLGVITDEQFQVALERFNLGRFVQAEAIPFGMWGQNVFVSSSEGEYVLRGQPHFEWQFPTEQFYTRFLHERTQVPVPWPYLLDTTTEIFGWSFVLMPRMPGVQIADPQVQKQLQPVERLSIARALGENLAHMQEATWPLCGRYNATTNKVEPFDLAHELAWPFAVEFDAQLASIPPTTTSHSERVQACLRHYLASAYECDATAMTPEDIAWVEEYIANAQEALNDELEPCLVMEDYKEGNLVVMQHGR
ncbi:MAG: aminoglycoside phosphotransferase family protein [Ktedonobacteraceae bacterium]